MNKEYYIRQCETQHVSNDKCYEIIDESTAQEHINKSMNGFLNCIKESSLKLPIEDHTYLHQANNNVTDISAF